MFVTVGASGCARGFLSDPGGYPLPEPSRGCTMGAGGARRAGIEIQTVSPRGCASAVVVRLTGVVDAVTVACLRDALSCLASRPIVIDVEGCTLASRDFGLLLGELRDRVAPCFVACPRLGARLLLGLHGEDSPDWLHGSVLDALAAMAVPDGAPAA